MTTDDDTDRGRDGRPVEEPEALPRPRFKRIRVPASRRVAFADARRACHEMKTVRDVDGEYAELLSVWMREDLGLRDFPFDSVYDRVVLDARTDSISVWILEDREKPRKKPDFTLANCFRRE